ncbi:hypothetical protein Tco_0778429 [Tanacetum coccineum]
MMMASKSYTKNPAHKALYDALIQLIFMDEDDMDRAVVDPPTQTKKRHEDKDQDPPSDTEKKTKRRRTTKTKPSKKSSGSKKLTKGNTQSKTSKTDKSMTADESVQEPAHEVAMDVEESTQDEGNTVNATDDGLGQTWFNEMVNAEKPPLTFDELMSTPIDFTAFSMNRLKLDKITRADLVGLVFKLLKGMLLLLNQHKLFNLDGDDIIEFRVALRMFTLRFIIQKRVEDVQLGVENYQRKLNISKPQRECTGISVKELYMLKFDPKGVIYEDKQNHKRLMRDDELYMFSDGTLTSVRKTLHYRLMNFRIGYNDDMPKRKWTKKDQFRSNIMGFGKIK